LAVPARKLLCSFHTTRTCICVGVGVMSTPWQQERMRDSVQPRQLGRLETSAQSAVTRCADAAPGNRSRLSKQLHREHCNSSLEQKWGQWCTDWRGRMFASAVNLTQACEAERTHTLLTRRRPINIKQVTVTHRQSKARLYIETEHDAPLRGTGTLDVSPQRRNK
jgi:hypothetical protein